MGRSELPGAVELRNGPRRRFTISKLVRLVHPMARKVIHCGEATLEWRVGDCKWPTQQRKDRSTSAILLDTLRPFQGGIHSLSLLVAIPAPTKTQKAPNTIPTTKPSVPPWRTSFVTRIGRIPGFILRSCFVWSGQISYRTRPSVM